MQTQTNNNIKVQQMDKPYIFVSYSHMNKMTVLLEVSRLEKMGYRVWIDLEGIEPGKSISKVISKAIANCTTFLIFISKRRH